MEYDHSVFDVCVIGAGVIGSATARHLAKTGHNTLLLEQFPLPHWRGSSHGQSRVFRTAYDVPTYVKMAKDSGKLWEEIELQAEEEFFIKNKGMLEVEEPPGKKIQKVSQVLTDIGVDHEVLSASDLKSRFPDLKFKDGYTAVLDKEAGALKADKCLRCLQDQFIHFGGVLRDGQEVLSLEPAPSGVTIRTARKTYKAKKLVLTAGPWTNKLLTPLGLQLPLKVITAPVFYWTITKPGAYSVENGFSSTFYDGSSTDGRYIFAIATPEYPNMIKMGPTGSAQSYHESAEVDPDRRDNNREKTERFIRTTSDYIRERFPFVDHREPAIVESCLYTMTPDEGFILDRHPRFDNIIIGAGFSAHGFKHAPVVGEILSELAMGSGQSSPYDLTQFKISRFDARNPKSSL